MIDNNMIDINPDPICLLGRQIYIARYKRDVFEPYYVIRDDSLHRIPGLEGCQTVLDMGTGTGVLPLIWTKYYPNIKVVGVDLNDHAVKLAKYNVEKANETSRIEILKSDLFSNEALAREAFDAIVFNGPHAFTAPSEQEQCELSPAEIAALYDPGLALAKRFFNEVDHYLAQNGFIVYTYSDYGDLKELLRYIAQKGLVATILSCVFFENERDVKHYELAGTTRPFWYNLIIKRCADTSPGEVTNGYVRAIHDLTARYQGEGVTSEDSFNELLGKVEILLEGLGYQIGNFLPDADPGQQAAPAQQDWLVSGYSLPCWGGHGLSWKLIYSFASASLRGAGDIDRIDKALNGFLGIIQSRFKEKLELVVSYLAKSGSPHYVDSFTSSGDSISMHYSDINKSYYEFDDSSLFKPKDSRFDFANLEFQTIDHREIEGYIRQAISYFETRVGGNLSAANAVAPLGVVANLWLNHCSIRIGKPLSFVRFKRIGLHESSLRGSAFFFSSFNPADSRVSDDIIHSLQTAIATANETLLNVINTDVRNAHARRSAVAAIMARNTSHNIGSHVSPRSTLAHIRKRAEKVRGSVDVYEVADQLKGRLDEMVQKKADFLAEITTEPLTTTKNAYFYREVVLPLAQNTLLMESLAANEGVGYEKNEDEQITSYESGLTVHVWLEDQEVKCVFENEAGDKYPYPPSLPYTLFGDSGGKPDHHRAPVKLLLAPMLENTTADVEVALPGPLGEYAFYGLVENYIRNVAKHHKPQLDEMGRQGKRKRIEVHIRISDPASESSAADAAAFYEVELSSNLWGVKADGDSNPEKISQERARELMKTLQGEERRPASAAENRRSGPNGKEVVPPLLRDLIYDDGSLRREAWGIAEMRISANLLRGCVDHSTEVLSTSLWLEHLNDEHGERLAYRFRMMKPKLVCVVRPGAQTRPELIRHGIWAFPSFSDLRSHLEAAQSNAERSAAAFQFALIQVEGLDDIGELLKLLYQLPFRVLLVASSVNELPGEVKRLVSGSHPHHAVLVEDGPEALNSLLSEAADPESEAKALKEWLWREWVTRRFLNEGKDSASLNVYFQQARGISPTLEWANRARNLRRVQQAHLQLLVWYDDEQDGEHGQVQQQVVPEASHYVVFDRHAGAYPYVRQAIGDNAPFMREQKSAYLILDKKSSDFIKLFQPPSLDEEVWTTPWELAEAGLLRVLVLDERVAERAYDNIRVESAAHAFGHNGDEARRFEMAWAANVFLCTHRGFRDGGGVQALHDAVDRKDEECVKEKDEETRQRCSSYLRVLLNRDETSDAPLSFEWKLPEDGGDGTKLEVDVLIVHQGIVDAVVTELLGRDAASDEEKKTEQDRLLRRLRHQIPYVVVDSGRGIPHSLHDEVKFLPFTRLQDFVLGEGISKYSLASAIMSLTRQQSNKPQVQ